MNCSWKWILEVTEIFYDPDPAQNRVNSIVLCIYNTGISLELKVVAENGYEDWRYPKLDSLYKKCHLKPICLLHSAWVGMIWNVRKCQIGFTKNHETYQSLGPWRSSWQVTWPLRTKSLVITLDKNLSWPLWWSHFGF